MTALCLATFLALAAAAQPDAAAAQQAAASGPYSAPAEGPDVELHVPKAEVQKLSLDVDTCVAQRSAKSPTE